MYRKRLGLLWSALASVLACAGPCLAGAENDVTLDFALGYDSNPLRLSREAEGSAYADLRIDASLGWSLGSRSAVLLSGEAAQRFHGSGCDNADLGSASAEARFAVTPYRRGPSLFLIALGARYGLYRATFIDPASGGVYQVPGTSPGVLVAIPDRFDTNAASAFIELRG